MGIEEFCFGKGKKFIYIGGTGQIDNKLGEIVLSLSQNNPISYVFYLS